MLTGLNHLTLAVSDVERSLGFYGTVLGFRIHASWAAGAYLSLGDLWLCLSLDPARRPEPNLDYTHYAFSIAEEKFSDFLERLRDHQVAQWKDNKSEGDSAYFLDPDGHKLEVHVGNLNSRLSHCREHPYQDMRFFD